MKLKTLAAAAAVAVASMPFAAQAEVRLSGDIGVAYQDITNTTTPTLVKKKFGSKSSNISFDASEKVGDITYYGHADADFESGSGFVGDDIYVGMKGGFGELVMGDTDNGCDSTDVGGTNEVWLTHTQGSCAGADMHNITYKRSLGKFGVAVSVKPTDDSVIPTPVDLLTGAAAKTGHNPRNWSLGAKGAFGPVEASLGYTAMSRVANVNVNNGATAANKGHATVLGLAGNAGPFKLGFRGSKAKGGKAVHGINFLYSKNGHNFYGGTQTSSGTKDKSLGYKRVIGNTDFIVELEDTGASNTDYILGVRHRF